MCGENRASMQGAHDPLEALSSEHMLVCWLPVERAPSWMYDAADVAGLLSAVHAAHLGEVSVAELFRALQLHYSSARRASQSPLLCELAERMMCSAVRLALRAGADVNATDEWMRTALFVACSLPARATHEDDLWRSREIADTLLRAGADPNLFDYEGETPLHQAARGGRCDLVQMLLRSGADASHRNLFEEAPIDLCRKQPDTYRLLLRWMVQQSVYTDCAEEEEQQEETEPNADQISRSRSPSESDVPVLRRMLPT